MSTECTSFRAALEAELLGRPSQERLAWLAWNEHLLGCADCRELLEKEEALEALLATLPEPRLPEALLERVLRRLRRDRTEERRLEKLLDLDRDAGAVARAASGFPRPEVAPPGLAAGILARLEPERRARAASEADARLDALLDLELEIAIPAGLVERTLRAVALARRVPRRRVGWLVAAAAGVVFALLGRLAWMRGHQEHRIEPSPEVATRDPEPDPQMLAALDVVEQWDLLMQDDVDVLLSTLGPGDEALLDYR